MYRIYSHTGGSSDKVALVDTIDGADAWVCPKGHPDRAHFDMAGDLVFDTIDEACSHCWFEDIEVVSASEAWTKKEGQNKNGGLNAKGRAAYNRAHNAHLKAPSKDKKNKRRKNFCKRMRGMKAKLTSAKTAKDPDSRINKSLRAWNC